MATNKKAVEKSNGKQRRIHPDKTYEDWIYERGIEVNGVEAKAVPGKGTGIFATRAIKKDDTVMFVPYKAMFTIDSPIFCQSSYSRYLEGCSVHNQLAIGLVLSHYDQAVDDLRPWENAMPSFDDFKESLPLFWPEEGLTCHIPFGGFDKVWPEQLRKARKDFTLAKAQFVEPFSEAHGIEMNDLNDKYKRAWALVNTRCFYWDYPSRLRKDRSKKLRIKSRDDCMALCPYIDILNHDNKENAHVSYSRDGYTVTAMEDIKIGQELTVSYGKYTNDFLLLEYGFILSDNASDAHALNCYLVPLLKLDQIELLEKHNITTTTPFLITADPEDPIGHCLRAVILLRYMEPLAHPAFTKSLKIFRAFMCGEEEGMVKPDGIDVMVSAKGWGVLEQEKNRVQQALAEIRAEECPTEAGQRARSLLERRWLQIWELLENGIRWCQKPRPDYSLSEPMDGFLPEEEIDNRTVGFLRGLDRIAINQGDE